MANKQVAYGHNNSKSVGGGFLSDDGVGNLTAVGFKATTQHELQAGNGSLLQAKYLTELTTITAAAYIDTTILIPVNAVVIALAVRVVAVAATAATYSFGIDGDTARFGGAASLADTLDLTVVVPPDAIADVYAAATAIRITPNATPGDALGRLRMVLYYYLITPPTA